MNLLLGVVAAVLTSVLAVYSAWSDKLPRWMLAVLIVASLASIATLFWTASEQATFEKRVLGGDGYVYATFEPVAGGSASKFDMHHAGDLFSVYDVHVEIYDLRKFVGVDTTDPRQITANVILVDRAVFSPQMTTVTFNTSHPRDCYGYWVAMTYQRNQNVMSIVSARLVAGKWESVTRVLTMEMTPRELKRVSTPGWLPTFAEATVTMTGPGKFHSTSPAVLCPP